LTCPRIFLPSSFTLPSFFLSISLCSSFLTFAVLLSVHLSLFQLPYICCPSFCPSLFPPSSALCCFSFCLYFLLPPFFSFFGFLFLFPFYVINHLYLV
jgi:hypothetical protein